MADKALFIFNPCSGKGLIKNHLYGIISGLTYYGYEVTVYPTKEHGDGKNMVARRGGRYKLIVIGGGDGTLNECINGILEIPYDKRPVIGYIPMGSTNDFASSLRLPKKPELAVDVILNGSVFKCDIGRFNDACFVYIAAFGAFTDVAYGTPQEVKNSLGHMAYILEGIKRLPSIKSHMIAVEHDGVKVSGEFIYGMVSNSTYVGGLRSYRSQDVSFSDGVFECVLIKAPENPIELQAIITGLLMRDFSSDEFYTFKAAEITIKSREPIGWTLDGEYGGDHDLVKISNLNEAVKIMVGGKGSKLK